MVRLILVQLKKKERRKKKERKKKERRYYHIPNKVVQAENDAVWSHERINHMRYVMFPMVHFNAQRGKGKGERGKGRNGRKGRLDLCKGWIRVKGKGGIQQKRAICLWKKHWTCDIPLLHSCNPTQRGIASKWVVIGYYTRGRGNRIRVGGW